MLFSRWFTNPIRKLSNGAQEIAAGNDVAIKVEHHDEIGRLAESFNI
ncbi:MAG: HAMP domain-containing protein [Gemmiger formicilis]